MSTPICAHHGCDRPGIIGTFIPALSANVQFCADHQEATDWQPEPEQEAIEEPAAA